MKENPVCHLRPDEGAQSFFYPFVNTLPLSPVRDLIEYQHDGVKIIRRNF